jgi:hypothetical protein
LIFGEQILHPQFPSRLKHHGDAQHLLEFSEVRVLEITTLDLMAHLTQASGIHQHLPMHWVEKI